jgi:hypothetical protein
MRQALRVISDPEISLAGVYLDPRDTGFSAFKFLESSLMMRPAVPVFLFNPDGTSNPAIPFATNFNVKAVFKGTESFQTLIAPLRLRADRDARNPMLGRSAPATPHKGYTAIPTSDLATLRTYPFDLFVEDETKALRLVGSENSSIDPEYLESLQVNSPWVYASDASIIGIRDQIREAQRTYMSLEHLPDSWRIAETLYQAGAILNEFRNSTPSDSLVDQAAVLIGDLSQLVTRLGNSEKLNSIIEMAKGCDRTLRCTILAVMMSKILGFEHDSIVEILGLASFFQDISLHQSPFGNLADVARENLAPEARTYFNQHPLLSADRVAKNTHLPEVTLQVIRQHHEQPDRTGFPNRIGGAQLHPMAEILSLINQYLDLGSAFHAKREKVLSHYSEGISAAFSTLLERIQPH